MPKTLETRQIRTAGMTIRTAGKTTVLRGYALMFNSLSSDLGGFVERALPGCCRETLASKRDIRCLVDHDAGKLLGRTTSKTLRLGEDAKGLWFEVDTPATSYAADVIALVARGDIAGCSFGFYIPDGGDRWLPPGPDGKPIRELVSIDLREVTVTSCPAYAATSVSAEARALAARRAPAPARNVGMATDDARLTLHLDKADTQDTGTLRTRELDLRARLLDPAYRGAVRDRTIDELWCVSQVLAGRK